MITRLMTAIPVPGFISRRAGEFYALLAVTASILIATALLTYHSSDPSWNQVGEGLARNALGQPGAILADILRQSFGAMTILLVIAPLGWAWRWLMKDSSGSMIWRVLALVMALLSGATLVALLAASTDSAWLDSATGALGIVVGVGLVKLASSLGAMMIAAMLFLVTLPLALGLRGHEYIALSIMLREGALMLSQLARSLWLQLCRLRHAWRGEEAAEEEITARAAPELTASPKPKKRVEPKKTRAPQDQSSLELRLRKGDFTLPSLNLLQKISGKAARQQSESALEQNARLLESVLMDFGIKGEITKVRPGPVVTLYELEPAPGIKSSRVIGLADDIARSMSAISARIAVIPGRNAIGIELPNLQRETVYLRELFEDEKYIKTEASLPLVLGKDISGEAIIADLARMPHLLVAGTTGSGKSVAINTMIMSLVYHLTPEQCKFIMIDPKMLELSIYDDIPHLLCPVVTEPGKALMLVAGKEIETSVQRLAQMARAAGIHIIMATQRPSVDVITGVIKANFPTRISFQVTSKIDSRTILGEMGAEQLLGQGDMLHMAGGGRITRVHGPFISDKEVEAITEYLRTQGAPVYEEAVTRDEEEEPAGGEAFGEGDAENETYRQAVQIVLQEQKASTSYIQRRLKLGYNRAARLIDQMEREGIVGPANHVGKREVLMR